MRIDLEGRTALVTGSTAGIGHAIALGLARAGADVVVNGRAPARVEAAAASVAEQAGREVRGVAADIGTAAGCAALIAALPAADVLVNNAGFAELGGFFEADDDAWQRHFDTNVMSGVRLTRHYAEGMAARGWGRVVFISSESGVQMWPEMPVYGMTKAAQLAVSRSAAVAVGGSGVTVNTVLPGPTITEATAPAIAAVMESEDLAYDEACSHFAVSTRGPLLGRMAAAEEVANLVVYLASEQAGYTTGAALRVDGGVTPTIV